MQTAGPALERKGDIAAFLTALEPRSVFFVDEIHRLARTLEETFYPAMEDHRLPITVGQGAGARVVTLELPPFTLVGATTRTGLLTTPLRDRFGIQARLEPYARGRARGDRAPLGGHPRDRARATTARSRSPRAAAARRAWPTACSSACATSPRCAWRASSPRRPRTRRWRCSRSTSAGSTAWTGRSCSAICAKFAGGPGRPVHAGGRRRRGAGHDRGRVRALPAAGGADQAHAARAGRDAGRLRASRARSRRRRRRGAVLSPTRVRRCEQPARSLTGAFAPRLA